jgi:hypothetical protein
MSFMSFEDREWLEEQQAFDHKVRQEALLLVAAQRKGLHPIRTLQIIMLDNGYDPMNGLTEEGWWLSQQVRHFDKWINHPRVVKHDNRAKLTLKQWTYLLSHVREERGFEAIEQAMNAGMKPKSAISAVLRSIGNEVGIHYR